MPERFIGEALEPVPGTFDSGRMPAGEPALPRQFRWESRTISVTSVIRSWRETRAWDHASGEKYARKHWFEVLIDSGETVKLYFERHARSGRSKRRWWIYSISS
jgi:hypothetical protein